MEIQTEDLVVEFEREMERLIKNLNLILTPNQKIAKLDLAISGGISSSTIQNQEVEF